ncbi:hypothetical protein EV182_000154 [Spiromyces aspiralis]|uniref:Uncharacterized protein n=1 Tax=Spiromyces aspiralis TaxID=68401 RepID=A0ACC1HVP6_9FUNG|nr:hypothetical protein EV182_000154 [Spiromyces aspiralis]
MPSVPAVFLFRNIKTSQVLASVRQNLISDERRLLKQIQDATVRPPRIRPDLWTPMVVAAGFPDSTAAQTLQTILAEPGAPLRQPTPEEVEEHRLMRTPARKLKEMNMIESKIAHLCRALIYFGHKSSPIVKDGIKLYWGHPEYQSIIDGKSLSWPEFVTHDKLSLKRGNIILNEELKNIE